MTGENRSPKLCSELPDSEDRVTRCEDEIAPVSRRKQNSDLSRQPVFLPVPEVRGGKAHCPLKQFHINYRDALKSWWKQRARVETQSLWRQWCERGAIPVCGWGMYTFSWLGTMKWCLGNMLPQCRAPHISTRRAPCPTSSKPGWPQGVCILREFNREFWCSALSGSLCRVVFLMTEVTFDWPPCSSWDILLVTWSFILRYSQLVVSLFSPLCLGKPERAKELRPKVIKKCFNTVTGSTGAALSGCWGSVGFSEKTCAQWVPLGLACDEPLTHVSDTKRKLCLLWRFWEHPPCPQLTPSSIYLDCDLSEREDGISVIPMSLLRGRLSNSVF